MFFHIYEILTDATNNFLYLVTHIEKKIGDVKKEPEPESLA